jgi:hypothetical protein
VFIDATSPPKHLLSPLAAAKPAGAFVRGESPLLVRFPLVYKKNTPRVPGAAL